MTASMRPLGGPDESGHYELTHYPNSRDLGKLYPHVLNWDDLTS